MLLSPRNEYNPFVLARALGILGLMGVATGAFDIGFVQSKLGVAGDAAATFRNIALHPRLFRLGFSSHLFELLINIPSEIIGFLLLKRVNKLVASISLLCGIIGIAIEGVGLLIAYIPYLMQTGSSPFTATQPWMPGMESLVLRMSQTGLLLSWVFYGIDEMTTGWLLFRSAFIPRLLGVMLALSGICYFTHGFLSFLAPGLDAKLYPFILYPCAPGEILTSLWFAVMGLSVSRWHAWNRSENAKIAVNG